MRLNRVIPEDAASDFNQGLIEPGAIVCVPNGEGKVWKSVPLTGICEAKRLGIQNELPVKKKAKARRIEERTVLIFKDGDHVAIRKSDRIRDCLQVCMSSQSGRKAYDGRSNRLQ